MKHPKTQSMGASDGVSVFLAKDCVSAFQTPLLYLYDLSLGSSKHSLCWKLSRVTSVPKGDAKGEVTQYRPIAVLSVFAKFSSQSEHQWENR